MSTHPQERMCVQSQAKYGAAAGQMLAKCWPVTSQSQAIGRPHERPHGRTHGRPYGRTYGR